MRSKSEIVTLSVMLVFLLPAAALAEDDFGRPVICSMTLNSSEERDAFMRHLSNKGDFDFVELYQPDLYGNGWLDEACESGVQCDVLLVSGHAVAGDFLGMDGNPGLKISALEAKACGSTCDGILKNPVETFLFGCNTLPDKELDERGPATYYHRLHDHGFSYAGAARAASIRYGAWGDAIDSRYRQVFGQVMHLYGFDSVAPTGEQIEPFLDSYLEAKGDYAAWLLAERSKVPMGTHFRQAISLEPLSKNHEAQGTLGYTNFKECHGDDVPALLDPGLGGDLLSEETLNPQSAVCRLAYPLSAEDERAAIREVTASEGELLSQIERVEAWVAREKRLGDPADAEVVANLKKTLPEAAGLVHYPVLVRRLVDLAITIGGFSATELQAIRKQGVRGSLFAPVGEEVADMYCDPDEGGRWNFVTVSDVPDSAWKDANARRALCCMRSQSPDPGLTARIQANGGC